MRAAAFISADDAEALRREVEAYSERSGVKPSRVTRVVMNDGSYYTRALCGSQPVTAHMADRLRAFMAGDQDAAPKKGHRPKKSRSAERQPPVDVVSLAHTIASGKELAAAIDGLYQRTARRLGCSVEAAALVLNYSPAQIQKMAA